jgi:alanine racemase
MLGKYNIDELIGIGPSISIQSHVFNLKKRFYSTTADFLEKFEPSLFSDSAILIKGSRAFEFEKISSILEEKVHTTILEINLNALVSNLNYFRSKLKAETKIMVMVKALSYGSGTYEIANVLQYQRVDYLGVAFTDEGVALRDAGIKIPIIVMNPELSSFELMIRYKLEPEVYSLNVLSRFSEAVEKSGENHYPVHLKIDTGMHRLGFMEDESELLISNLVNNEQVKVASIFSHLAGSDEDLYDSFTEKQIAKFEKISQQIVNQLGYPVIRHILNSAGIERFPNGQFDMVRLGIGLYGISALSNTNLANVSTFKSTVIQKKHVSKNETIGYGRKGEATSDKDIAIIPVGYADGLNRQLSNGKGRFYINGYLVPIIGNICMDMCMVDITGCEVNEGDEVIIFGKEMPVIEVAKTLNTIPYEIFTGISTRVKRVYYHE